MRAKESMGILDCPILQILGSEGVFLGNRLVHGRCMTSFVMCD